MIARLHRLLQTGHGQMNFSATVCLLNLPFPSLKFPFLLSHRHYTKFDKR